MERPTRRTVLRATPGLFGALAGCEALLGRADPPTTGTPERTPDPGVPERRVELRNETGRDQFVSLAVSERGEVVGSTTVEVPRQSATIARLPAPSGVLTVELETTTGLTATHQWVVGRQAGDLVVTLSTDDVSFAQSVWCSPQCAPLSRGGSAAELPYYGGPVSQTSYYGANVVVRNTIDQTVALTLQVTHDGDRILAYDYVVPPDVTLEFPGVHSAGDYTVSVESELGDLTYAWRPPKERRLRVLLTPDGVEATCGESIESLILGNDDRIPHRIDVSAFRPGGTDPVLERSYIVAPGARFREKAVFTGSGQYELEVGTADGARTTYDWWLCPPRGPTEITVQSNGELHVVQYQPGE